MTHPDLESLIRYHDGELNGKGRTTIEAHVNRCDRCRLELSRFQSALAEIRSETTPTRSPALNHQLLKGIKGAIRRWEAEKSKPEQSGEALKRRVASTIGPFLGDRASRKVLQTVSDEGNNLLSTIERVLVNFLGERAASELVSHVVDAAIVRDSL